MHSIVCQHCGSTFVARKKERKYCSRRCAAIVNNTHHPKNPRKGKCTDCGAPVFSKTVRCKPCHDKMISSKEILDKTLDEMTNLKGSPTNAHGAVRWRARKIAKELGWSSCCMCGYDKHIEVAHKKPITDFGGDTLVSVINAQSNLLPLCPNCHWEFDRKTRKKRSGPLH